MSIDQKDSAIPKEVLDQVFKPTPNVDDMFGKETKSDDKLVQPIYGCPNPEPIRGPKPDIIWAPRQEAYQPPYYYNMPRYTYPGPICGSLNNFGSAPGAGIHIRIKSAEFICEQWMIGCVYAIESPKISCRAFLVEKSPEKLTFLTVTNTGENQYFTITAEELCEEPKLNTDKIAYSDNFYPTRIPTMIYPVL